ncbi:collagen alpha-5(vi) chain [Plakobranchus ocellatus]|uniref:Collagen alpha-5(Vi) chain n=1 Tax=Plakobranchus ocellatus TaxID=259542 RepID=A0AAV4DC52_9GAST|nr:collagen alpha-5(vi) chain [Plakobranchus ocellatus]
MICFPPTKSYKAFLFELHSILTTIFGFTNSFQIRQASNTPCVVDGRTINSGDTFVLTLAGPCNKFLCDNGHVMPSEYGCERDGKCFPVGDLYSVGCIQRQCGPIGGNFAYSRVNEGCSVRDVCLGVNEIYSDGCYKYQCNKGGTAFSATYSLDLIEWGCSNGGKCYPENATLAVQCRTMTCQRVNGIVGFRNTQQGCSFGNQCLQIGETLVDACRTFKCSRTSLNGIPIYSVDPIETSTE